MNRSPRRFAAVAALILGPLAGAVFVALPCTSATVDRETFPPQASLADVRQLVHACPPTHPRLFASGADLAQLRESSQGDPLRRRLAGAVIRYADEVLAAKPVVHRLRGKRLLHESQLCLGRVLALATAYHLSGEQRYVDRCRDEMLVAARFSDWNPSHFLDTAEMTLALAVGYDWLYDRLDEESRRELRTAIVDKGVKLAFDSRHNGWTRLANNWGQVCHAGMTAGALAVCEDEPELAARTVHNALRNVVPAMEQFAPHGGYPEGPHYWGYGASFNALLIDALESTLETDFGLSAAPGFAETGGFLALACGPTGEFYNYSDSGDRHLPEPILAWFAQRFDRGDWLRGERRRWEDLLAVSQLGRASPLRLAPLMLLWRVEDPGAEETSLPLHWNSGGKVPVSLHRSSWTDPRATFVGIKGGSPADSHGHMDAGAFVLEADGVRWAVELGREEYFPIESRGMNLWSSAQDSDRWKIFRLSNFGHGTLVVDDQLQHAAGRATLAKFSADSRRPGTILDLTDVYRDQLASARRGVALLASREVVVQDELSGLRPGSRVRWGMITRAEPHELGADRVELRQEGETLSLRLREPAGATWDAIDVSQPRNEWDTPNRGARMIVAEVLAPANGRLTIAVTATPGSCPSSAADQASVIPPAEWPLQ
ncbi:MAG: heparinase II/III family protein [Pirellulales bacterium]|nr:heparinase II/III family protein [Pirellulales bacterium]